MTSECFLGHHIEGTILISSAGRDILWGYSMLGCFVPVPGRGGGGECHNLLPTGSEGREVLGSESIPVAILPSC